MHTQLPTKGRTSLPQGSLDSPKTLAPNGHTLRGRGGRPIGRWGAAPGTYPAPDSASSRGTGWAGEAGVKRAPQRGSCTDARQGDHTRSSVAPQEPGPPEDGQGFSDSPRSHCLASHGGPHLYPSSCPRLQRQLLLETGPVVSPRRPPTPCETLGPPAREDSMIPARPRTHRPHVRTGQAPRCCHQHRLLQIPKLRTESAHRPRPQGTSRRNAA